MDKLPLGILVSGTGTNLQAIIQAVQAGALHADIRIVISNKAGVGALDRAAQAGILAEVISHKDYAARADFDAALAKRLREAGVEWVVLAGFMRVLTPTFLDAFPLRVINVHPALLPAFPGVDAQGQALAYGARLTGCTVHFVDAGTDTGPIIAQAAVPVLPNDTRESLAHRVLTREHQVLTTVLQWIAEGRVRIEHAPPNPRPRVVVHDRSTWFGLQELG